jgi:protein-tyrosine phosphatase
VTIDGCCNLRDLGGFIGMDGRRVRNGLVFRSAAIGADGRVDHPIRYVVDMRTDKERQGESGPAIRDAVVWSRDYVTSSADLRSHLIDAEPRPEALRRVMLDAYVALPREQAPAIAALFSALAQGRLPLLFHCAVGKDRTGVAAALLLSVLGVSEEAIIEDYLLSNASADQIMARLLVHPLLSGAVRSKPEALAPLALADADYLAAMFSALKAEYGNVAGYLDQRAGVAAGTLDLIRDRLLD